MSAQDETLDSFLRGKLSLLQPKRGYRASLDAVLLARFATVRGAKKILDLGSGNGAVALMLAVLHPAARVVGLEVQESMVERARRNIELNRLGDRVRVVSGDVRRAKEILRPESFDIVVSNPPYGAPRSGRVNPNAEKRIARHEILATLADFLAAAAYALRKGGAFAAVFPASRAIDLLAGMRQQGLEPKRVRFVHSGAASPASLVLAEGRKEGGRELEILPPLVVYDETGKYTPEVSALLEE
ncbi:MAG TPA: methyltransferase [Candidatus Acidoferrales bacterium]|nr:methyltransferase [Candidatus Acidoferrales bacterium]